MYFYLLHLYALHKKSFTFSLVENFMCSFIDFYISKRLVNTYINVFNQGKTSVVTKNPESLYMVIHRSILWLDLGKPAMYAQ